jgi:hypothetical protein
MTQRIVAPAAAIVAMVAATMAGATISLLFTIPTGRAAAPPGSDILPFFHAVLTMIADAVWSFLQYL